MTTSLEIDGVHVQQRSQRILKPIYMAHGMKRSGNHAIIGWMLSLEAGLLLHNNAIPIRDILLGARSLSHPLPFEAYLAASLSSLKGNDKTGKPSRPDLAIAKMPASIGLQKLASWIFQRRFGLICSLEDHDLDVQVFDQRDLDVSNLLILRSPENLFASRLRKGRLRDHPAYPHKPGAHLVRSIETWKSHAREFLGRSNVLPNRVGVYFDLWFQSETYREEIASKLGLAYSPKAHGDVASFGGGSSFDGRTFDGAASKMKVLERAALLDDGERELLEAIVGAPEIRDLKAVLDEAVAARTQKDTLQLNEARPIGTGERASISVSSGIASRQFQHSLDKGS